MSAVTTKAMENSSKVTGILPLPPAADKVVSEPADQTVSRAEQISLKIDQLQQELSYKTRSYGEQFGRMENLFEEIQNQLARIGNFCDRSISRDSRRSTIANSFIPNQSPRVAPVNFIQTERPRTNFSTKPPKLTTNTHAKFIKSIRLEFPKYSSESEPVYWFRQAKHFFYCYGFEYEDHVMMATFYLLGKHKSGINYFMMKKGI